MCVFLDNLRAEITRLSRGYQQVLERLENTTVVTTASATKPDSPKQEERDISKSNRPLSGKSRNSDASQTKNRPKSAGAKVPITTQNVCLSIDLLLFFNYYYYSFLLCSLISFFLYSFIVCWCWLH